MPVLKQIEASIKLGTSDNKLKEYGTRYTDGFVETYVAIPDTNVPFSIHAVCEGDVAPGLAGFVFIDGEYQCNRNNFGPMLPGQWSSQQEIELRFRQKEEKARYADLVGRDWIFTKLNRAAADDSGSVNSGFARNVGTIEVVFLRCRAEDGKAPTAGDATDPVFAGLTKKRTSAAMVPLKKPLKPASTIKSEGFGGMMGLFDGTSTCIDMGMDGTSDHRPLSDGKKITSRTSLRKASSTALCNGQTGNYRHPTVVSGSEDCELVEVVSTFTPSDQEKREAGKPLSAAVQKGNYGNYQPPSVISGSRDPFLVEEFPAPKHSISGKSPSATVQQGNYGNYQPASYTSGSRDPYLVGESSVSTVNSQKKRDADARAAGVSIRDFAMEATPAIAKPSFGVAANVPDGDLGKASPGKAKNSNPIPVLPGKDCAETRPGTPKRNACSEHDLRTTDFAAMTLDGEIPVEVTPSTRARVKAFVANFGIENPPLGGQGRWSNPYEAANPGRPGGALGGDRFAGWAGAEKSDYRQFLRERGYTVGSPNHAPTGTGLEDGFVCHTLEAAREIQHAGGKDMARFCMVTEYNGHYDKTSAGMKLLQNDLKKVAMQLQAIERENLGCDSTEAWQDWHRMNAQLKVMRDEREQAKACGQDGPLRPKHGTYTEQKAAVSNSNDWQQVGGGAWNPHPQNRAGWSAQKPAGTPEHFGNERLPRAGDWGGAQKAPKAPSGPAVAPWDNTHQQGSNGQYPQAGAKQAPQPGWVGGTQNGAGTNAWGNNRQSDGGWNQPKSSIKQNGPGANAWGNNQRDNGSWNQPKPSTKHTNNGGWKNESSRGGDGGWGAPSHKPSPNNGGGRDDWAAQNNDRGWAGGGYPGNAHGNPPKGRSSIVVRDPLPDNPKDVVESYWKTAGHEQRVKELPRPDILTYPSEKLPPIPEGKAPGVTHGVHAGRGADYKTDYRTPTYMDTLEKPYAIFRFQYRTKEKLRKIAGLNLEGLDKHVEKLETQARRERYEAMEKEQLVDKLMARPSSQQAGSQEAASERKPTGNVGGQGRSGWPGSNPNQPKTNGGNGWGGGGGQAWGWDGQDEETVPAAKPATEKTKPDPQPATAPGGIQFNYDAYRNAGHVDRMPPSTTPAKHCHRVETPSGFRTEVDAYPGMARISDMMPASAPEKGDPRVSTPSFFKGGYDTYRAPDHSAARARVTVTAPTEAIGPTATAPANAVPPPATTRPYQFNYDAFRTREKDDQSSAKPESSIWTDPDGRRWKGMDIIEYKPWVRESMKAEDAVKIKKK